MIVNQIGFTNINLIVTVHLITPKLFVNDAVLKGIVLLNGIVKRPATFSRLNTLKYSVMRSGRRRVIIGEGGGVVA